MNDGLKVLKRDNKKVDFNGEKIAIAIKKSFDSREEFIEKYSEEDINKVYMTVLDDIFDNYFEKPYIKVEDIQDIIEKQLLRLEYQDVYESFSNYRDKRTESRRMFLSEPKQHKLLKAIEKITLKQDWVKKTKETKMDTMFNYGKTISEEIANAYFIDSKFNGLNESGQIYINDLEYVPMGTIESFVIPFNKVLEKGFYLDEIEYKQSYDVSSSLSFMSLIIRKSLEDISGNLGLPNFDNYLSPFVTNTFKDEFKNKILDFLDLSGFSNFLDFDSISKEINKIESMNFDMDLLYKYSKDVEQIKSILDKAYSKAVSSTKEIVYKNIYNFLHTSNYKIGNKKRIITVNIGTDTSLEGKIITQSYLNSIDKNICYDTVFKIKDGINAAEKDPNFDLLDLAISKIYEGNNISFSFLNSTFNNSKQEDVFYFKDGTRILENINQDFVDPVGRGLNSKTYLNLTRIAIKNVKQEETKEDFLKDLSTLVDLTIEQLYERFDIQANKKTNEFPFIMGESLYMDSKGFKPLEKVKKSIKNGVYGIALIGLKECSKLINISEKEIYNIILDKLNGYKKEKSINFVLMGPDKNVSKKFLDLDRTIYGDIKNVTHKDFYDIEFGNENYQEIFNGGYFFEIDVGDLSIDEIIKIINKYKTKNYGYISLKKEV